MEKIGDRSIWYVHYLELMKIHILKRRDKNLKMKIIIIYSTIKAKEFGNAQVLKGG